MDQCQNYQEPVLEEQQTLREVTEGVDAVISGPERK